MLTVIVLFLVAGGMAGFLAGLLGIGGGVLVVQVLLFIFVAWEVDAEVLTHLAIGTSLATILVTGLSSIHAHHRRRAVRWQAWARMLPGLCLGGWLGVQLAVAMDGARLQMLLGIFLLLVALRMYRQVRLAGQGREMGNGLATLAGTAIGSLSTFFGIGGGILSVPFLHWCRLRMQEAVATAAACGLPVALVGTLSNVLAGWQDPRLPPGSSGFVYWPAVLGITLTSVWFAPVGAAVAHRMSVIGLRRAFAFFLLFVGLRLIVLNWNV